MIRSASLFLAMAIAAAPVAATTYSATVAVPVSGRFIARDIAWSCGPSVCEGATDESRPIVLCQSLAKRAGRLQSFLVDGVSLAPAELARCNGSAKIDTAKALAGK